MFDTFYTSIQSKSILDYENAKILYNQMILCDIPDCATAEIGVYQGMTSKLIKLALNKQHYCYDTFDGICGSESSNGDKHNNGEFNCGLDIVKQNINMDNIIYESGLFPITFKQHHIKFCFVYSDTATYYGTKHTFECFKNNVVCNGKIIFYKDTNCDGVNNAISEFKDNEMYTVTHINNFIIFTKTTND